MFSISQQLIKKKKKKKKRDEKFNLQKGDQSNAHFVINHAASLVFLQNWEKYLKSKENTKKFLSCTRRSSFNDVYQIASKRRLNL